MPTTYLRTTELPSAVFLQFNAKCDEKPDETIDPIVGNIRSKTKCSTHNERTVDTIQGKQVETLYGLSPQNCYFFHACGYLVIKELCSFESIEVVDNIYAKMILMPYDNTDNSNPHDNIDNSKTQGLLKLANESLRKKGYFLADSNPNMDINLISLFKKTYYDHEHCYAKHNYKDFIDTLAESGQYCGNSSYVFCYYDINHRLLYRLSNDMNDILKNHDLIYQDCAISNRKITKEDKVKVFDIVTVDNDTIKPTNDFKVLRIISSHNCEHLYLIMPDVPEKNSAIIPIEKATIIAREAIAEHAKIGDIIKYILDTDDQELLKICKTKTKQRLQDLVIPEFNDNASTINISRYKLLTQQAIDLLATFSDKLNEDPVIKNITEHLNIFKSHKNIHDQIIKIKFILLKEILLEKLNIYTSNENKLSFIEDDQNQKVKKIIADYRKNNLVEIRKMLHIENEDRIEDMSSLKEDLEDVTVSEIAEVLPVEDEDIPFILQDAFINAVLPAKIFGIKYRKFNNEEQKVIFTDEELGMLDNLSNIMNDLYSAISHNNKEDSDILINYAFKRMKTA